MLLENCNDPTEKMGNEHENRLFDRYVFILNVDLPRFKMIVLMAEMIRKKHLTKALGSVTGLGNTKL